MMLFDDSLPRVNGKVRLLHAIPDGPNVDVYFNGKLIYSNLAFGTITEYISIPADKYKVQLYKAGTKSRPLITEPSEVQPNGVYTIAVTYENGEISFFVLDDTHNITNPLLSSVRFINLSPDSPLLSLRLPENVALFDEVSYLETNEYYPISPGIYNFLVVSDDGSFAKYISNIRLRKAQFITIYIIGLFNKRPQIGYVLVQDDTMKNTRLILNA